MTAINRIYSFVLVLFVVAIAASTVGVPAADAWSCKGLTATPSEVFPGEEVKLKWDAPYSDIAYVTIDKIPGTQFARDGFAIVKPTETTVYTAHMHKDGRNDTLTCSAKVTVKQHPKPVCTLDVDKTSVPSAGGDVVLTWTTDNATEASFNQNIGGVDLDGNRTQNVTADTNFVLTAKGPGGTVQCMKTVVTEALPPAPECTLTSDVSTLPQGGGNAVLTWTTKNATSVSFDQGIGVVTENGSRTEALTASKTFVLTATGNGGTKSCPVTVTVPQTEEPLTCSDVNLSVSDTTPRRGDNITLSWSWNNNRVTSASIDQGIGNVSNNGNQLISVSGDITYTITIKNATTEKSCPINIDVDTGGGGGGGSSSPRCELEISKKKITAGQEVELSWNTSRATRVVIKDNHNKEILDTNDYSESRRDDHFDGEEKLKPTKDTTYTLTASRGSRERTCKVSVDVTNGVTVTETRNQPLVAGISLTEVPYTGFEAGPALTYLFYTLLTLWADRKSVV